MFMGTNSLIVLLLVSFPALLHLAPNSPDAKVFEVFAKGGKANNNSAPAEGN